MARYWRSSAAVLMGASALGVALAYGLPAVYESKAELEIVPAATPPHPESAADAVKALLSDQAGFGKLLHDSASPTSHVALPVDSLASHVSVVAKSERVISLSFRAGDAVAARSGCSLLADAIAARFDKGPRELARAAQAQHQKELADFVNAHPDVALDTPPAGPTVAAPGPRSSAAQTDFTLGVLRKQKTLLEQERAAAQSAANDTAKENPYDDNANANIADLDKRINELKYAIVARQKAASSPVDTKPAASAMSPAQLELQAQWRRLVKALVGADAAPAPAQTDSGSAQILVAASLPDAPIRPNRKRVILVSILSGTWLAVLAALLQVVRHDRRRQHALDLQRRVGSDRPLAPAAGRNEPSRTAAISTVPPARAGPSRVPSDPPVDATEAKGPVTEPIPKGPGTRLGMMDPALFRTQIGGTPAALLGRGATTPGAGVIVTTGSEVEAGTGSGSRAATLPSGQAPTEVPAGVRTRQDSAPGTGVARKPSDRPLGSTQRVPSEPPGAKQPSERPGPRQPSERTRPSGGPSSARPSRMPMPGASASKTSDVFSPPPIIPRAPATGVDFQQAPSTQRFGTYNESLPKTISPPPPPPSGIPRPSRPDTKYSFVDASRASRPPPPVAEVLRPPPQPSREGSSAGESDLANGRSAARGSVRPPVPRTEVEGEVWEKVSSPKPVDRDLVVRQPVPSSWRMNAVQKETNGVGVLSGLRDQIFELAARGSFVLGVTSESTSLEQKTEVAARITAMLSGDGRVRVLLLEANFDSPSVHRVLSIEMPPATGFSQQLRARLRAADAKKPWTVLRCTDRLDVLAEGLIRTPGVLMSQEFANAVAELRNCYDVIVIDSPVVGNSDMETKPIDAVTDGIAIVAPNAAALGDALARGMRWFGKKKLMVSVPAGGVH